MHQNKPWKHLGAGLLIAQLGCGAQPTATTETIAAIPPQAPKETVKQVQTEYPDDALHDAPREVIDDAHQAWELEFSLDSSRLSVSGVDGVSLWDTSSGAALATIQSPNWFADVELSPDGTSLASIACGGGAALWSTASGALLRLGDEVDEANDIDLSPDGSLVAASLRDGTSKLWDAKTGATFATLAQGTEDDVYLWGGVSSLGFSRDGAQLFTYSKSAVLLWDTHTGKKIKSLFTRPVEVFQSTVSQDGATIITLSRYTDVTLDDKWSSEVMLWDIKTGALRSVVPMEHRAQRVALSPDGTALAVITASGRVDVLDVKTSKKLFGSIELNGRGYGESFDARLVVFSPGGASLAVGYEDGNVQLWDMKTQQVRAKLKAHRGGLFHARFSPDGVLLATAGSGGAKLWEVSSGELRFALDTSVKTPTQEEELLASTTKR